MSLSAQELWDAWRTSPEIRDLAEAWLTKPDRDWTADDDVLYQSLKTDPDRVLSIIFAAIQLTDNKPTLKKLGAGPLENFLGLHVDAYVQILHTLALQHQPLREALDGVWQGALPNRVWHQIEILKQSRFT